MLRISALFLVLAACADAPGSPADPPPEGGVKLEEVVSGLTAPVYLTAPAGDARLFVVEQPGRLGGHVDRLQHRRATRLRADR